MGSYIVFLNFTTNQAVSGGKKIKNTEPRNFMNFVASAAEHTVLCFFISPMRSEALTHSRP